MPQHSGHSSLSFAEAASKPRLHLLTKRAWTRHGFWTTGLMLAFVMAGTVGCGEAIDSTADLESDLAELSDIEGHLLDATPVSDAARYAASGSKNGVQLSTGDSFNYTRTVEQSLTQHTRAGRRRSKSNMSVKIALRVAAQRDNRFLMTASYSDVQYSHDIAGHKVQFNSGTPAASLPAELQPYRGLAGNEFSFWMQSDGSIAQLEGFDQFLQRCVRYLPESQQAGVINTMKTGSANNAVATFLDESMGLFPAGRGTELSVGDSWNLDRQQQTPPMPLYLSSTCSLRDLSNDKATVSIQGKISAPAGPGPMNGGVQLQLRDGRTLGDCQFDRATGLPVFARIEQLLDMNAVLNDGTRLRQIKQVVTTLQADGVLPVAAAPNGSQSGVQQASGTQANGGTTGVEHAAHETAAQYPGNPFDE